MHKQIKKLRLAAHLTQTELAQQMGYKTQSIVTMWENGERKPPSDKLPQLAKIFGCTIDELYGEKETE